MSEDVDLESFKKTLNAVELKATPFRLELLSILKQASKPLSAAQLLKGLLKKKNGIPFDRATLFRNLRELESKGLLELSEFGQGAAYYSIKVQHRHQHHIFCVRCEKVEAIDFCGIAPMIDKAKRRGYTVLSHHLELTGLCAQCA